MKECSAAVVLAAGSGSRMRREDTAAALDATQRAAAERGIKAMIPDARGRPFLDHVLSSLADGGITDACLVVGRDHDAIREHYMQHPTHRITLDFVTQESPRGTADALGATEPWTAGREFLVLNADNVYPLAAIRALVDLGVPGLIAFAKDALIRESNIEPARIASYAILQIDPDDCLVSIIEKPGFDRIAADGTSEWIGMNLWRFDREIFTACRDVAPSPRGELELPIAVALAITRGMRLRVVRMSAGVLDLSNRGDVRDVARRLGDRDIQP